MTLPTADVVTGRARRRGDALATSGPWPASASLRELGNLVAVVQTESERVCDEMCIYIEIVFTEHSAR